MPELLLYYNNPESIVPPLNNEDLANSFKKFDLIDWHQDGWAWGEEELKNPAFRIGIWSNALESDCFKLLLSSVPEFENENSNISINYIQPRINYMDLSDPRILQEAPDAIEWWADITRTRPTYTMKDTLTVKISDIIKQRPEILR